MSEAIRTRAMVLLLLFLVIPGVLLLSGSGYAFRVVDTVLIFAILAVSMNLITGVAGLLSLGHAAFYGVGAYAAALTSTKLGWPMLATVPFAGICAALLGVAVALPSMRLTSIYFAVATLGIGQMIFVTLLNWVDFTGGPLGIRDIPRPALLGFDLSSPLATYLVCAALGAFAIWVVHRCTHGYFGNALRALREGTGPRVLLLREHEPPHLARLLRERAGAFLVVVPLGARSERGERYVEGLERLVHAVAGALAEAERRTP